MKNTIFKSRETRMDISAALPRAEHGETADDVTAEWQGPVRCVNLRPGADGGRLVPVDDLVAVTSVGEGSEPMLSWHHPMRGECLLLRNGNSLAVAMGLDGLPEGVECCGLGVLESKALCAIAEGDGRRVVVMTARRVYYVRADEESGGWVVEDARPTFPAVTLMASSYSTISAEVGERVLKGSYNAQSRRLEKVDRDGLRDDVCGAIEEISCVARAAGRCVDPLLMRYRLKDETGQTLFVSPVVMVGTDRGWQWSGEMSCGVTSAGSGLKREGFTVEGESYVAQLRLPSITDESLARRVKVLEVEAAGGLHCADVAGIVWNRLDASGGRLRFHAPGAGATMATDTAKLRELVVGTLARFEEMKETVACVSEPFSSEMSGRTIDVDIPGKGLSAEECNARMRRELKKPAKSRGMTEMLLSGCGMTAAAFTAGTAACNGDTTVWGNVTVLPFEGWGAGHYATATRADKSWTGTLSVERSVGRATCNSADYDHAPAQLSPLIVWPGEDGGTLTLKVKSGGGTAVERLELRAIPGSGVSVWLSATMKPLMLDYESGNAFTVGASTVKPVVMPGTIAGASAGRCLEPCGFTTAPGGLIAGITVATALSSAWDFSRDRFYVLGDGGIHLCVTNARHEPVALQLIDRRSVKSGAHIAVGTADRGVAAIASGEALTVRGSKTTDLPGKIPAEACGIGWDGEDVWILLADGKVQVRPGGALDHFYIRDNEAVASALSCGDGRLHLIDRDGFLHDSRHRGSSDKEVEWCCRVEMGNHVTDHTRGTIGAVLSITAIGIAMVASAVRARLTATTDGGAAPLALARLLLSVMISGTMKEALFLPVRGERRHWFQIGLKGRVSADMRLSGMSVHMR